MIDNEILELTKTICRVTQACHGVCNPTNKCNAYKYAKRVIEAGYEPKNEWISVDERLPESGVHCLLCCDIKRIDGTHSQYVCDGFHAERWKIPASGVDDDCVTEYNEEDDEYYINEGWYEVIKNWDEYTSIAIDDTVTHWMPLPKPPKGE